MIRRKKITGRLAGADTEHLNRSRCYNFFILVRDGYSDQNVASYDLLNDTKIFQATI